MKKKKFSLGMPLVYLLLIVWALTTIYPLIWVVMNSFKDKKQIVSQFLCPAVWRPVHIG